MSVKRVISYKLTHCICWNWEWDGKISRFLWTRGCLLEYQQIHSLPYAWAGTEESSLYKLENKLHRTGNDVF